MLQASPLLSFFLLAFCLLFLLSISALSTSVSLKATPLVPQLISICMLHKKEKKIKPVWNTICFLLRKRHHKFTSCHVRVSILLRISFSRETCTSVIQDRNPPHLGLSCVRGGGHCWEGECDWQTNGPRLLWHMPFSSSSCELTCLHFKPLTDCSGCKTGIFNYSCGLFPINKILRKKENCLLACLLPGFLPSCGTQPEWLGQTPWLLWKQEIMTNEPRQWSGGCTPSGARRKD